MRLSSERPRFVGGMRGRVLAGLESEAAVLRSVIVYK